MIQHSFEDQTAAYISGSISYRAPPAAKLRCDMRFQRKSRCSSSASVSPSPHKRLKRSSFPPAECILPHKARCVESALRNHKESARGPSSKARVSRTRERPQVGDGRGDLPQEGRREHFLGGYVRAAAEFSHMKAKS
jgi:hypothetical protein